MRRTQTRDCRRGVVAVEAAIVLPVLIILMFGVWEVGRLIQVNQIVVNGAREGARLAAGGYTNGTPVTSAMVKQAVQDYLASAGLPTAAANGAQVTIKCLSAPKWTDPSDALPLDRFQLTVKIPAGTAFDSMSWSPLTAFSGVQEMSTTVDWRSLNNSEIVVNSTLPY